MVHKRKRRRRRRKKQNNDRTIFYVAVEFSITSSTCALRKIDEILNYKKNQYAFNKSVSDCYGKTEVDGMILLSSERQNHFYRRMFQQAHLRVNYDLKKNSCHPSSLF
jgi:hypothetical protein